MTHTWKAQLECTPKGLWVVRWTCMVCKEHRNQYLDPPLATSSCPQAKA